MANGGTLFLDELTEMPPPLQAKLLRVIQDGVVRRVGSESTDANVDVRFISATNRDPQQAVESGILRGDLFYRLRVVRSRCRRSGNGSRTSLLTNHFLTTTGPGTAGLGPLAALERRQHRLSSFPALARQRRELQNVIEHVAVLVEPDQDIQPADIPVYDDAGESAGDRPCCCRSTTSPTTPPRNEWSPFEKEYFARLVSRAGGTCRRRPAWPEWTGPRSTVSWTSTTSPR